MMSPDRGLVLLGDSLLGAAFAGQGQGEECNGKQTGDRPGEAAGGPVAVRAAEGIRKDRKLLFQWFDQRPGGDDRDDREGPALARCGRTTDASSPTAVPCRGHSFHWFKRPRPAAPRQLPQRAAVRLRVVVDRDQYPERAQRQQLEHPQLG